MIMNIVHALLPFSILFLLHFLISKWSIYCGNNYYRNTRTDYDDGFIALTIISFITLLGIIVPILVIIPQIIIYGGKLYISLAVITNIIFGLYLSHKLKGYYLQQYSKIKRTGLKSWIWICYWQNIAITIILPVFVLIIYVSMNLIKLSSFNKSFNEFMSED